MDSVSPEARSRIMASIRGRDTEPELIIRRALHARGFRFRVDARDLPGRPDLKLTKHGAVIFVHGCFWHGHNCSYFRAPLSNAAFWTAKVEANRARDLRVFGGLRELGWRVCVVWECALRSPAARRDPEALVGALSRWLAGKRPFLEFYDRGAGSAEEAGGASGRAAGQRAGKARRASYGRNESAALFAAERRAAYRGLPGENR